MSSFNGENLFGSGQHVISIPKTAADKHQVAFPGVHGKFQANYGYRGAIGTITGRLEAASITALYTLVDAINRHLVAGTCASLVDNWGSGWTNVVISEFTPKEETIKCDDGTYVVEYTAKFEKLSY